MSRNERAARHDAQLSDDSYDEEAEYIKSNKAFDRENKWLDERCRELESKVKSLERVITVLKTNSDRKTKRQLRIDNAWDGEEVNLSDKVSDWVKAYLFPRYKFLKDGWMEYSNDDKSLSGLSVGR
jgi:DNA polymerase sigma